MEQAEIKKCCDNCIHYKWYYDKCTKFDCEVDARSVCSEFVASESEKCENNIGVAWSEKAKENNPKVGG